MKDFEGVRAVESDDRDDELPGAIRGKMYLVRLDAI